jgi:hypothetical protein
MMIVPIVASASSENTERVARPSSAAETAKEIIRLPKLSISSAIFFTSR